MNSSETGCQNTATTQPWWDPISCMIWSRTYSWDITDSKLKCHTGIRYGWLNLGHFGLVSKCHENLKCAPLCVPQNTLSLKCQISAIFGLESTDIWVWKGTQSNLEVWIVDKWQMLNPCVPDISNSSYFTSLLLGRLCILIIKLPLREYKRS